MTDPASDQPHRYLPRGPRDSADFAIATACSEAWDRAGGPYNPAIPIGTVAALALWPLKGPDVWATASWWLELNEDQLTAALKECWARWWMQRPELIHRAKPLYAWLRDDRVRSAAMPAVRAVVHAAVTGGILELVGSQDPYDRTDTDILGWIVTLTRSAGQRRALGEFPTTPDVAALTARLALADVRAIRPGQSFVDPTSGTGSMIRATAQHLRENGLDPAEHNWSMTDLDPLSAAVAACCALLWDLGPNVLVWCGNLLHEADAPQQAAAEKALLLAERDATLRNFRMISACMALARAS